MAKIPLPPSCAEKCCCSWALTLRVHRVDANSAHHLLETTLGRTLPLPNHTRSLSLSTTTNTIITSTRHTSSHCHSFTGIGVRFFRNIRLVYNATESAARSG